MDAIVKASFWTDHRVEECPAEVKLAALWLVTNPARDLCGFTQVSNKRFEFETSSTASSLQGVSKGLPSSFLQLPGGTWFAVNFLRHQFGKGGRLNLKNKVIIAAVRHASKLPEVMREAFFQAYPDLVPLIENQPQTTVSIHPPSIPHPENRDGVRVRVREGAESSEKNTKSQPDPVAIVNAYPRNENRNAAYEEVRRQIALGEDPEAMLAGTCAIAAIIPQMPSGHLNARLVSSLTFFREKRWKDDPKTWLRGNARPNGETPGTLNLGGRKPVKL